MATMPTRFLRRITFTSGTQSWVQSSSFSKRFLSTSSSSIPTSASSSSSSDDDNHKLPISPSGRRRRPLPQRSHKQQRHRLDVALVGAPNAGKSQLLNVLTQSPIAAVSRKRHTTRTDILGARTILSRDDNDDDNNHDTQIVFKDTPGFMRLENAKEERLDRDLIVTAAAEMQHVDYTLLVVDAARALTENYRQALVQLMIGALHSKGRIEEEYDSEDDEIEERENMSTTNSGTRTHEIDSGPKFAIVLNKTDLVHPKSNLLDMAMDIGAMADICLENQFEKHNKQLNFEKKLELSPIVFYVSALQNEGVDDIVDHLVSLATPCQTWAVPSGQSTNLTPIEQVQEIIREKIYRSTHREVPHSIQQVNRMFRKVQKGLIIHQDLVVFTKSHQRLVQGRGGMTLQRIQEAAQRDLTKAFGCNVALQLHVKLSKSKNRQQWNDEEFIGESEGSKVIHTS